jgi:DNA-binding CsgD family transcriptional regulator
MAFKDVDMVETLSRAASHGAAPNPSNAGGGGSGSAPAVVSDHAAVWQCLASDSNVALMVQDSDGLIAYCNDLASKMFPAAGKLENRRLHDFSPAEFADERVALIREAIASARTITVDGMLAGLWRRTTYRPMIGEPGQRQRVLVVMRPVSGFFDQTRPVGIVRAKYDDPGPLASLTSREMEILCLIGEGLPTAEIAKRLHRSVKTIEWHRVSLGNKLGIANRVELARIAIRAGLVNLENPSVASA